MLRRIWDGFLSLIAAALAAGIAGVPSWFTHVAVQAGLAPLWAYAAVFGLVAMGVIMFAAFLRKMRSGVSPLRERPRRRRS